MDVRSAHEYGPWILTLSGRRISVLDPDPASYAIEDIAHGCAVEPRFGGQTPVPFSVAQHQIGVKETIELLDPNADPITLLQGLIHDAAEGVGFRDLPTPLKAVLSQYRHLERVHMAAIRTRFDLPCTPPPIVKKADAIQFARERRDLFRPGERRLRPAEAPLGARIVPWPWRTAEKVFLREWDRLVALRAAVMGSSVPAAPSATRPGLPRGKGARDPLPLPARSRRTASVRRNTSADVPGGRRRASRSAPRGAA